MTEKNKLQEIAATIELRKRKLQRKTPNTSTKKTTIKMQVPDKQKKSKDKKTGGRKPWVPDYGKIESWATQGLWDKEIAALSGITHQVFCQKKNELPELVTALEVGRAKGTAACSQKLLSLALAGSERSLHFYLERISGRKNTLTLEIPKKPIHEMTDQEIEDALNGKQIE